MQYNAWIFKSIFKVNDHGSMSLKLLISLHSSMQSIFIFDQSKYNHFNL